MQLRAACTQRGFILMRLLCMHMHSPRTRCDDSAIVFACEFPLRLLCRAFVGARASFAVRDFVVSHFCFHTPACVARLIVVRRF